MKRLFLLLALLTAPLLAQNAGNAPITKKTGTNLINEDLVFGSGRTLNVSAGTVVFANNQIPLVGVGGLGTGVATWLATPTSANLAAAVTNETGSGSLVFATSPTLVTPALGTPTALVLTNATGLPATALPAFTGDATTTAGSTALVLATVNSNVGSFGSATAAPTFTVNAKGLLTAAGTVTITPAYSSITSKPTTISGYGITDGVTTARTISTTAPLTGGGDLTANRTLAISTATTSAVGAVQLSTPAQVIAGTDNATAAPPLAINAGLHAYVDPIASSRASLPGLNFDGSQQAGGLGGGAVLKNFTFPSGDLSIICNFTRSSDTNMCLMGGSWGTVSLSVGAGGGLTLQAAGGTGAFSIASVCPGYGIPYSLMVIRGGGYYRLYVNGSLFGSAIADNGFVFGTPASLGGSSSDTGGPSGWSGTISKFACINRALSAAEVATLFQNGQLTQSDSYTGSMTALNTSAFTNSGSIPFVTFTSASATGFTATQTVATNTRANMPGATFNAKVGQRFLLTYTLVVNSGSAPSAYLGVENTVAATPVYALTAGTNQTLVLTSIVNYSGVYLQIGINAVTNFTLSNVSLVPLGALLNPDANPPGAGYQWKDASGNAADIILPATGVTWSAPNATPITTVRGTTATSGNQLLLGQISVPVGSRLNHIRVKASTGTPTITVGSTSGGTDIVASVAISTSWTDLTLATRTHATGNTWINSSTAATLYWDIGYSPAAY